MGMGRNWLGGGAWGWGMEGTGVRIGSVDLNRNGLSICWELMEKDI